MVHSTRKKRHLSPKKQSKRGRRQLLANGVWLSGRMHIEERLNEGPPIQREQEDENVTKTKQRKGKWQRASTKTSSGGYKFAPFLWKSTIASEAARASLLWAVIPLVLLATFGHTIILLTAYCRSSVLAFSAPIHFTMKRSAPCSAILRHSPSSWVAVVH